MPTPPLPPVDPRDPNDHTWWPENWTEDDYWSFIEDNSYAGMPGDGTTQPTPANWSSQYNIPGSPAFWRGLIPDRWDSATEFAALTNALMPFMSPEDQRATATQLFRLFPEGFNYNPETTPMLPMPENANGAREQYTSRERAQGVLDTLDKVLTASGREAKDFGTGYQYLRQIATALRDFGGNSAAGSQGISRRNAINLLTATQPMLSEAENSEATAPYLMAARGLISPTLGRGSVLPVSQSQNGDWIFGSQNKEFYG